MITLAITGTEIFACLFGGGVFLVLVAGGFFIAMKPDDFGNDDDP